MGLTVNSSAQPIISVPFLNSISGCDMRNLLNLLLKYDYCLLFLLLEIAGFLLLFRFNSYQGSVFFTSANRVFGAVYDVVKETTAYFGLRTVNKRLVEQNTELFLQVEQLTEELKRYTADTTLIGELRSNALRSYTLYDAEVVNNSVTHKDNYITINKGEIDGIRLEMGVIGGNGIVGIVYKTSPHYALVLSVLNSKSSISCKIHRTEYLGLLKWEGGSSHHALLTDMPRHSEFMLGDTVVTSGYSAVFPGDIPVGVVEEIADSEDALSYILKIRLFTDFARLNDVRVISASGREEQVELERHIAEIEVE